MSRLNPKIEKNDENNIPSPCCANTAAITRDREPSRTGDTRPQSGSPGLLGKKPTGWNADRGPQLYPIFLPIHSPRIPKKIIPTIAPNEVADARRESEESVNPQLEGSAEASWCNYIDDEEVVCINE
jgi:hypothetical protein